MPQESASPVTTFLISARAQDLAFLQGVLEASEGIGVIHGTRGGEVRLVTPRSRSEEARQLLADLQRERGLCAEELAGSGAPLDEGKP